MEIMDEIEDVSVRINKVKTIILEPLLKEKQRLMVKQLGDLGCQCGTMIIDYDVSRVENFYCPTHHPQRSKT